MRQFYDITTKLKDTLEANSQVNVVTTGDIFDIDLNKQTIFPLSHNHSCNYGILRSFAFFLGHVSADIL